MSLSIKKGNGGFIGADTRANVTSSVGSLSIKKHYLERLSDNFTPPAPGSANILFQDNFSTGDLSKWTVLNGSEPSDWIVGTGTNNSSGTPVTIPSGSTYAAYISNNGSTNVYSSNTDVHMYFDFDIPASATSLTLTFEWMCWGERSIGAGSYDYGYIIFADPSLFTPSAGTEYASLSGTGYERIIGSNVADNNDSGKFTGDGTGCRSVNTSKNNFVPENITIDGTEISTGTLWSPGSTRRLVFSWASDSSVTDDPSWTVANVKLIYS
jgi:hypothetical protein